MRSAWLAIGVLIISVASAQTPSNKQEQVRKAILLSRYVYVDRKAIVDVLNALRGWNRLRLRSNGAKPNFSS
jgi:hypothetical protein